MRSETKRIGAVLGVLLAAMLIAGVRRASAWQYTLDGACSIELVGECVDAANSVVVDAAGDIIAGGQIGVSPYLSDGLVVKFSGQLGVPSVLWETRLTSDMPVPANQVNQVALDAEGNVLVVGYGGGYSASFEPSIYMLAAKISGATGAILWEQHISYGSPTNAFAYSLAVDSAGNIAVAGTGGPYGASNWMVVKLNGGTGTVLWQATGPIGNYQSAYSVTVDHADNVLAAGVQETAAVVKYDGASGTELWVSGDSAGEFRAVAVDASDHVVAAGGALGEGFVVKKLDTDGTPVWRFAAGTGGLKANALTLDDAGNVFATGQMPGADTASDMATFKIDGATGTELWHSYVNGGGEGLSANNGGNAIALDPSGNPVVGGMLTPIDRGAMAILKLDAATGNEIWRTVLDGPGTDPNQHQQAFAVAVDARGDVLAAGDLNPVSGNYRDFAVVKLNGDGTDFVQLCGNGVLEGSETCDDGNAAAGDGCSDTCQTEAGFLCLGEPSSCVVPVGVAPKKLVVVDKLAASGSAKTVFAAKDANVRKGTGTDPTAISAAFTAAYANGAARGGFAVPAGAGWLVNTAKVAKYVNKMAPAGPTQTKVALIRPGSTLSLTAKGIGDTPFDIVTAGDPAGDVNTAYCVSNGGPTICHCSVNQSCVFTKVAGDTGAKLKCKGGVADATCAALLP